MIAVAAVGLILGVVERRRAEFAAKARAYHLHRRSSDPNSFTGTHGSVTCSTYRPHAGGREDHTHSHRFAPRDLDLNELIVWLEYQTAMPRKYRAAVERPWLPVAPDPPEPPCPAAVDPGWTGPATTLAGGTWSGDH